VETVSAFREGVPGLTLSTDLIVGYPGETDGDHRANLAMIRALEPDIVNVTRFSPRPGTPAASADGPVAGWRAKERSRELTAARFEVSARRNAAQVGRRVSAFGTEPGRAGSTALRTDEYWQVVVPERLPLGKDYEVDIVGSTATYLLGARVR
jgi:threonylcarbamoyladenosine tRNA methylthiotransferase CDKAL1